MDTLYLLTHHRRLLGTNAAGELVHVSLGPAAERSFVAIQNPFDGQVFATGPLTGFTMSFGKNGVHLQKNGKFLCAEPGNDRPAANRQAAGVWETFIPIPKASFPGLRSLLEARTTIDGEIARLRAAVNTLLAEGRPVKIYCGCGPVPRSGFINFDITTMSIPFLLTNRHEYFIFPFADMPWGIPDDCVDYIYHEDFIEHITQLQQIQFLAEAWRVLKPRCYHRINTPNLIAAMRRHSVFKDGFAGVYTGELKWGHKSLFSPASLKETAELVGYREVIFTTKSHGVSPFAEPDVRPKRDRDEFVGNIFADLQK